MYNIIIMIKALIPFIKKNWFIFGIFIAVIVGYYFPSAAAKINKNGYFSTLLVIVVFFLQGLGIQMEKIIAGIKNIKLHIFILFFTFIFFPLYFFAAIKIFPFLSHNEGVTAGLFVLACLPTTIVASVVFTDLAGGNASTAIFNTVISNTIGVFVTPLLFSLLLSKSTLTLPLSMLLEIFTSLAIRIIIPMGIGMVIKKFIINFADNNRKKFSYVSSFAVLFILFTAFAGSSDSITIELIKSLYPVFIFLALTYLLISFIVYKTAGLLNFETADIIAAVFTSTQKTLTMGIPLITLYFVNNKEILGLVLIPILFYHPWQIFMSGFIANLLQKKKMKT